MRPENQQIHFCVEISWPHYLTDSDFIQMHFLDIRRLLFPVRTGVTMDTLWCAVRRVTPQHWSSLPHIHVLWLYTFPHTGKLLTFVSSNSLKT